MCEQEVGKSQRAHVNVKRRHGRVVTGSISDHNRVTSCAAVVRSRNGGVDVSMIGCVFLLPLPSVIEEYEKEEDTAADAEAEQRPPIHAQHPPVGLSLKKKE